jgi:hypothetical protein
VEPIIRAQRLGALSSGLADPSDGDSQVDHMPKQGLIAMRGILVGVACLLLGFLCRSQTAAVTPQTIADLHAKRWTVRRNAFERLAAVKDDIDNPRIQKLLIRLREKENVESNMGDIDLYEDDDYLAYEGELTSVVQEIAVKTNNPNAWKALVYGRYNGDSEFGNWLSSHRATLPFLIRRLESPLAPLRMDAVYVLANMLAKSKGEDPFPPAEYRSLKQRVRSAAAKGNPAVRQSAMKGLGLTKDLEDVPFLEKLAKTAPDPDTRKYALNAAREIRESNHYGALCDLLRHPWNERSPIDSSM